MTQLEPVQPNPGRTVAAPGRTVAAPGRTVAAPGRTLAATVAVGAVRCR